MMFIFSKLCLKLCFGTFFTPNPCFGPHPVCNRGKNEVYVNYYYTLFFFFLLKEIPQTSLLPGNRGSLPLLEAVLFLSGFALTLLGSCGGALVVNLFELRL